MQTLRQAIVSFHRGEIRGGLGGCPVGGWGDTAQARRQLLEELPLRQLRDYTLDELIDALYYVDAAGRYRVREG